MLFFFTMVFTHLRPFYDHINFRISLSISITNWKVLRFWYGLSWMYRLILERSDLIIPIYSTHVDGTLFHLFGFSWTSLSNILQFSVYTSCIILLHLSMKGFLMSLWMAFKIQFQLFIATLIDLLISSNGSLWFP